MFARGSMERRARERTTLAKTRSHRIVSMKVWIEEGGCSDE